MTKDVESNELSEEQLWSWVDRDAPELEAWLAEHPERAAEVAGLRQAMRSMCVEVPPVEQVGPYRLGERLGEGGMGVVYAAVQPGTNRPVAVKLLRDAQLAGDRERVRFAREIQALGRLQHPAIATIHDAGVSAEGVSYYAMERVDGRPLTEFARAEGQRVEDRVRLLIEVCRAVHHAHERGVIHRDLKPSNILVDQVGAPRVLDFGLARLASPDGSVSAGRTRSGSILGSLPYMSPEQAAGRAVDPRCDIYSLGVLLYELLTDRLPIVLEDADLVEAARRIGESVPRKPSRVAAGAPRTLDAVAAKALAKRPEDRYLTAADLAEDLERFLRGEPVRATRPSRWRRLTYFTRRNTVLVALASLVAILLLTVGIQFLLTHPALRGLTSGGFPKTAPFEGVRWRGQEPLVLVDGSWYELAAIDREPAENIVEYCKRHAGRGRYGWKKRFEQDLWQVLARMGNFPGLRVDLTLVDLESNEPLNRENVWLTSDKRRAAWRRYKRWGCLPFTDLAWNGDQPLVEVDARWQRLTSLAGIPVDRILFFCQVSDPQWKELFVDSFVHVLGDVLVEPEGSIELGLAPLGPGEARIETRELSVDNRTLLEASVQRSPFERIAWDAGLPVVFVENEWWELTSVAGEPTEDLLEVAAELAGAEADGSRYFELNVLELLPTPGPTVELGLTAFGDGGERRVTAEATEQNWRRALLEGE